jgi:pimeloyl-ACP methyl ester carboxylesterase
VTSASEALTIREEPYPIEEVHLVRRTLAVRRAPADAPRAIFIHGLGGSSLNWTDQMHQFEGRFDSWALDLGGFGMSPPPRDGDYSPAGHARSVIELITELNLGPVHLFGNSLGGAVAINVAARRPDLIASATFISPALPSLYATRGNAHLPAIAIPGVGEKLMAKFATLPAEEQVRGSIAGGFADESRYPEIRFAEAVAHNEARREFTYSADAFLRSLRGLLRSFTDFGSDRPWKLAERITAPSLFIYGRKDPLVDSRTAHRVTKHVRDSHVVVLPDTGHMAQMEHPEFVTAAWDRFLS